MTSIDLNKISQSKKSVKVTSVSDKKGTFDFLNKDIKIFGSGFNDKKKEHFYSELLILFSAGVDIQSALELIEDEQEKKQDKKIFSDIKGSIISGSSLSAALEKTGHFTLYEFYSIQIGEESGRLTEVLSELAIFFTKKIQQKRQITSALSYPVVVLFTSFGALFFMMKFVVPMFSDTFKRLKGELPYITRVILRVSEFFGSYSLYLIAGFILLSIFLHSQKKATWLRKFGSRLILRTPVMKGLIGKIYLARFCQSMNLLISAKTPLVTAIGLVKKMVGFYPIEISLDTVQEDITRGLPLHVSLAKFPIYGRRMTSLIKVAEEVNKLDAMFAKLAKQYSDEVDHQTSIFGSLIEPIMIVLLGLLVGVILIAMYLPMFQMSTMVG